MNLSRREFLVGSGGFVLGAAISSGGMFLLKEGDDSAKLLKEVESATASPIREEKLPDLPWHYEKLDPVAVAERGYKSYLEKHCMYGAFNGIIGELREKVGFPYTRFPDKMMEYGKGGVVGWGSLCGALNGAAAAINLVSPKPDPLIDELFRWYEVEALPNYRPQSPKFEIPASKSESVLCHASISNWVKATGFKSFSPERSERCGWLAASTAKFAAELLNKQAEGTFTPVYSLSAETKQCRGCHDQGSAMENTRGKMECIQCHSDLGLKHPSLGTKI